MKLRTTLCFAMFALPTLADSYKLVLPEDSPGTHAMFSGDYSLALSQANDGKGLGFNEYGAHLSACVALVKLEQLGEAEKRCNHAVRSAKARRKANLYYREHLSAALNNRGVLMTKMENWQQAELDFRRASNLSAETFGQDNLDKLNQSQTFQLAQQDHQQP